MGRKKHVDSHMLSLLRDNYTEPLNSHLGASIVNKKWSELLYHTNRYMQRGSLMENYAIRKLQEQIICQVFDLPSQHCNTPVACCRPATKLSRRAHRRRLTRLQCAIIHCLSHHVTTTVKPRKWWPQKWRTSLDGGWYLDLLFLKWRGKTSENGGFFLGKLSNQYHYIIRVYNKLQVRSERTLRL